MNLVVIFGNLGADPVVREVGDTVVANLRVATNKKRYNDDGELETYTTWHNVAVWGRQGEIAEEFLKKGDPVLLQCEIVNRQYEKDGVDVYTNDLRVVSFGLYLVGPSGFEQADDSDEPRKRSNSKRKSSSRTSSRSRSNGNRSTRSSGSRNRRRDEDQDAEADSETASKGRRKSRSRRKPEFSE